MSYPVEITFKGLMHSDRLHDVVKTKAESLSKSFSNITACHVVLEQTQKHKQHGKLNNVRVHITAPEKKEIVVTHNEREDIYMAVRDAFQDATRQLEEHNKIKNSHKCVNPIKTQGKIVRLYDKFGFIESLEGSEYYFNTTELANCTFDSLSEGDIVQFHPSKDQAKPYAQKISKNTE